MPTGFYPRSTMDQTSVTPEDSIYDLSAIGSMDSEPHPMWDQWYFAGESSFNDPFPLHGNDCHQELGKIEGSIPEFIHHPLSSARTSSFLTQDSLEYQPGSDTTNPGESSSITENSLHPSPPQCEENGPYKSGSVNSSSRRSSTKKHQVKRPAAEEFHVDTTTHQCGIKENPASSPSETNAQMKKLRARNNHAAGKVRVKKREEERNLEITEKDMEQTNRELTADANELASQVHSLKMQLLQHVGCDCVLIQEYIASQAQRYVKTSTR
jgi:hypothetical protein